MAERRDAPTVLDLGAPGALERWFAAAPWGLAVFDRQHRFIRVNAALAAMDDVAQEDHPGRPVDEVLPALAGQLEPLLARALERGETIDAAEIAGRIAAEPAEERRWAVACFPLRGEDGSVQAAAAMLLA